MDITKTNREFLITTNRSVYNKYRLIKFDCWSTKERRRRRRGYYYKQYTDKFTYYGYNLIEKVTISSEEARFYINQYNYGIEWEWRTKFKHTEYKDKRPCWKLSNKCKHQYQTVKLKSEFFCNYNLYEYKF